MTKAEMNRRLADVPVGVLADAEWYIRRGWGGNSLRIDTGLTAKQVNAVFQLVQGT